MTEIHKEPSVSREEISIAILKGQEGLAKLLNSFQSVGDLVFILENIGSLPPTFGGDCFIDLLKHENKDVRLWAIKNLGKLKSIELIPLFKKIVDFDSNTSVKREAVSSIGRMRSEATIPVLYHILQNPDPKIVCQAIRGLLVFKGNTEVDAHLKELINHENEMVVSVIRKEYYCDKIDKRKVLPHPETYPFLVNVAVNGDVRDVLKYVPEESIHLTFTSPPYYNARDYSIYPSYDA